MIKAVTTISHLRVVALCRNGKRIASRLHYSGVWVRLPPVQHNLGRLTIRPNRVSFDLTGFAFTFKIIVMQTIRLLEYMKSCVTQGEKIIPSGTIMRKFFTQLQWSYFKDDAGNILIIMGFSSPDWDKIEKL